jgi:hypothetical protein
MYKCTKCSKEFTANYLLKRHEMNKYPCDNIKKIELHENDKINDIDKKINEINEFIDNIQIKINGFETKLINNKIINITTICIFCKKEFSSKQNTTRHIRDTCPIKKNITENLEKLNDEKNKFIDEKTLLTEEKDKLVEKQKMKLHNEEMKKLRRDIAKLLKKQSMNINITNNKITNNNLLVNINSFGKEDLSHITIEDYKKFLSGFFPGFIKFIEKIHFDVNVPENHNICITNLKSKYIYIYDNGKWDTKEKNDIIDKFIYKKYIMLADKCDELGENNEIDENILNKFSQFSENYKDKEAQKYTKDEIMLMIYNNKGKVNLKH